MIDFTNLPVRNKTNAGANGIAENVTDFLFWWISQLLFSSFQHMLS